MTWKNERGFSLAEIMIAVFIIALMGGVAVGALGPLRDKARRSRAIEDIKVMDGALEIYEQDNGAYPGQDEGLKALVDAAGERSYLKGNKLPKGPWSKKDNPQEYVYVVPGPSGMPYDIICYGKDNQEGGDGANKDIKLSEIE